jgi:hypothetical protein
LNGIDTWDPGLNPNEQHAVSRKKYATQHLIGLSLPKSAGSLAKSAGSLDKKISRRKTPNFANEINLQIATNPKLLHCIMQ